MKTLALIFIFIIASLSDAYAQHKIIKGRVIDNYLEAVPYTLIMINDTVKVGRTDLNGFFQIEMPISVKKMRFASVGIEQAVIELGDSCDVVEVVMMFSWSYDFITLKQVDRRRMKIFKTLPELHRRAFEKGIFKTDIACYTQEFEPHYKKKTK